MKKYQNILVIIDPDSDEQKALNRAVELAKKTQATITAFLSIFDLSYEMTTMLSPEERATMRSGVVKSREEWLKSLIAEPEDNIEFVDLNIHVKVVWHNRPFEAIIHEVINEQHDIVIKGTRLHTKLEHVIFTPTDWHLLRKCPCPVLLVKDHLWPSNGNVLAALKLSNNENEHDALDKKITNEAKYLAELIEANVHYVNAYPTTPINLAIEAPALTTVSYNENIKVNRYNAMAEHSKLFNIEEKYTYIKEGNTHEVIEYFSEALDSELVIIGTIGRTGLTAALLGNVAEQVIDNLNCDLLALKPDEFVCPLIK